MKFVPLILALIAAIVFFEITQRRKWRLGWRVPLAKPPKWRDMSPRMRVLAAMCVVAWSLTAAMFLADSVIENDALYHPFADEQYHHPHFFKRGVYYLSDGEERAFAVVHPMMFWSWAALAGCGVFFARLNQARAEKEAQAMRERLLGGNPRG